jgi:hypothetical protein
VVGLALCLLAARFLFDVPFRGSLWIVSAGSLLYLVVALGIGLLISTTLKAQFVAGLVTVPVAFLPALMLSGFIFDLRCSLPPALKCLVFGYVVSFDLNQIPYAAFDRDRSGASYELLAAFDGSRVFQRIGNLERASDVKTVVDDRHALFVIQIDQDFARNCCPGNLRKCK